MVRTTALVAVSMTWTALVVTSTTLRYRPSRENPRPWTSISPLYIAPSTSASTSMRGLPSAIVPSTLLVFGLITLTVLESWSAVYTRSFAEIGCAPGSAGACVTRSSGGWVEGAGVGDEDPRVSSTPSATAPTNAVTRPPTIQVVRRFLGCSDMVTSPAPLQRLHRPWGHEVVHVRGRRGTGGDVWVRLIRAGGTGGAHRNLNARDEHTRIPGIAGSSE